LIVNADIQPNICIRIYTSASDVILCFNIIHLFLSAHTVVSQVDVICYKIRPACPLEWNFNPRNHAMSNISNMYFQTDRQTDRQILTIYIYIFARL